MTEPKTPFDRWWWNEGSGIPPLPGEDAEEHVHRVCEIAWETADYLIERDKTP